MTFQLLYTTISKLPATRTEKFKSIYITAQTGMPPKDRLAAY